MDIPQAQLQFLNQPGPPRSSHSKVSTRSAPARLPSQRALSPVPRPPVPPSPSQRGRSPGPRTPVLQPGPPAGRDISVSPLSTAPPPEPQRTLVAPPERRQPSLPRPAPVHPPIPPTRPPSKKPPSPGLPRAPTYKTESDTDNFRPAQANMSGIDPSGIPQSALRPGASKNLVDFGVSTGIFRNIMRLLPSSSQANIFPFPSSRISQSPFPAYLR